VRVVRVRWIEMLGIEWLDHPSIYASGRAAPVRAGLPVRASGWQR
jgi:hypothetical protein